MRSALLATFALIEAPAFADERDFVFAAETSVASMIIDRGEQLAASASGAEIVLEWAGDDDVFYAGAYRLSPIGSHTHAFPEEVDYFIGYGWSSEAYSADVSAAWLTYPGEAANENSLELAGEVVSDFPLSPAIAGFYDTEFKDWGLEISAGPEWTSGNWTTYTLARAGFVSPGDGSPDRAYAGVETGASGPLSDSVEMGLYARAEMADKQSFADAYSGSDIISTRRSGVAFGLWIVAAH